MTPEISSISTNYINEIISAGLLGFRTTQLNS